MAILTPFLIALVALCGAFYKLNVEPMLELGGIWRTVIPRGTETCHLVSELQACEKIMLHQPTGHVYAACSSIAGRHAWLPALNYYNASARSRADYVAVYDPSSDSFIKLAVLGLDDPRGLSLHGMDVVPSEEDPSTLFVYLVNHRPPVDPKQTTEEDPSVEIFTTVEGSGEMRHVRTVADPAILHSPNDVAGTPDGTRFWFTNDMKDVDGWKAKLYMFLNRAVTSVGFCHVEHGCMIALDKVPGANGIVRTSEQTLLIGSATRPEVRVLARQANNTLLVTDVITHDLPLDNLTVDKDGVVWAAGFPKGAELIQKHIPDPLNNPSASTAVRITCNGGKCTVDKPFESDGSNNIASGTTTVVHDTERNKLFLSGVMAPGLTVCDFVAPNA
ncbi:hypothetical protein BD626DRAFT_563851 [Schizophyllum amplum]|uniref:SMP-30/Gluconolactonase/LRE-like region domain-containing protein n=1 Tax=Schizophyllum amplum TaxID=97359 RepID=A0A550CZH7_9AGAR|nr:hypothetical protein BD626DRAFT_563851 [Auriculariopsis ampla]